MASASSTRAAPVRARASTFSRVVSLTPAAGPITAASTSAGGLLQLQVGLEGPQHHRLQVRGVDRPAPPAARARSPGPRRSAGPPRAASRAAPVLQASPLTTISRPRACLCEAASGHGKRGSQRSGPFSNSCAGRVAPGRCRPPPPRRSGSRPGSSTWAGFLAWKVTVRPRAGRGAARLAGVARHAARHVDGDHPLGTSRQAARPPSPPRPPAAATSPAPNRASIQSAGLERPVERAAPARPSGRGAPGRRCGGRLGQRARPPPASRGPSAGARPHSRRRRCCPGRRARRPAARRKRAQMASATAVPARSISIAPGRPGGDGGARRPRPSRRRSGSGAQAALRSQHAGRGFARPWLTSVKVRAVGLQHGDRGVVGPEVPAPGRRPAGARPPR